MTLNGLTVAVSTQALMLADGETVKYSYGWVFVHMTDDTAEEKLQEAAEEVEQDISALEGKRERERKSRRVATHAKKDRETE